MSGCCSSGSGSCCCGGDTIQTVSTKWTASDRWGALKVRFDIGRDDYTVEPGLYAAGKPNTESPVLVSANYKLTFDKLRKELDGLDCWLLILDTKGVNVWCAAGKGTFGTDELVDRIAATSLAGKVSHHALILPQLAAPGVCAHEVKQRSGFTVTYGPIRAADIKAFLAADCNATKEMRTVRFNFWDRLLLTPVELVAAAKWSLVVFGVMFLVNLFAKNPFELFDFLAYCGAILTGTVLAPLLLPIVPGRAFAWKGWVLGLIATALTLWLFGWFAAGHWLISIGYLLALPALSGFLAMNFTGSSTYTSFSGVTKEMKYALPPIVLAAAAGAVLLLIGRFV